MIVRLLLVNNCSPRYCRKKVDFREMLNLDVQTGSGSDQNMQIRIRSPGTIKGRKVKKKNLATMSTLFSADTVCLAV